MIYVASPYTNSDPRVMQERYEAVAKFCAEKFLKGNLVFSPIAHWHPIAFLYSLPKDADWWRQLDEEYLINSTDLWVLELVGWRKSKGVKREIAFAMKNKIRINHFKKGGENCNV